jgi:hypothetical protein
MRCIGTFRSRLAAGLAAAIVAGCASSATGDRVDSVIANRLLEQAAIQVKRCYRSPRVPSHARQIVTSLELRLNTDGTLAGLPLILSQEGVTPANRPYAARMAEAASLAVIKCAPLHLPPEFSAFWDHIELKFSPRVAV